MRRTLILSLLLLAGCQGYQRWDLDPEGARREWRERDVFAPDVVAFAADLAKREAAPRVYNPADGVDLAEAEVICLFFNPELRAKRLDAEVQLASAREAGRWDNPEFDVSIGRVLESVAEPWKLAAGISFTIPLSGRPGIERDLAFAQHRVQWREVLNAEWETLITLRALWRSHAATLRRAALIEDHLRAVNAALDRADKLVKAGELHTTDGRLLTIEQVLTRADLADTNRLVDQQRREIKAWLGLAPSAQLEFRPSLNAAPTPTAERDDLARENSPAVAIKREEYEVAEHSLRLEVQKQYPDLRLGPSFELDDGQSAIFLGLGIPIPLLNQNQQGIAAGIAARRAARAHFDAACLRLYADLDLARVQLSRARTLRGDLETNLAPLVDKQMEETNRRAELGEFDALLMLEALKSHLEAKQRILDAALAEAEATDALAALAGPNFKTEAPKEK
ncbi:MAG: TolC family protein [Planctomycetes bacterium]|nr:TolC family protein [Planctomycetota bacterium]